MDSTPILIKGSAVLELLNGIQELCDGMCAGPFNFSVDHYIGWQDGKTLEEAQVRAFDFVATNYSAMAGAFRLVGTIADILGDAIANDDIRIEPGAGHGWRTRADK